MLLTLLVNVFTIQRRKTRTQRLGMHRLHLCIRHCSIDRSMERGDLWSDRRVAQSIMCLLLHVPKELDVSARAFIWELCSLVYQWTFSFTRRKTACPRTCTRYYSINRWSKASCDRRVPPNPYISCCCTSPKEKESVLWTSTGHLEKRRGEALSFINSQLIGDNEMGGSQWAQVHRVCLKWIIELGSVELWLDHQALVKSIFIRRALWVLTESSSWVRSVELWPIELDRVELVDSWHRLSLFRNEFGDGMY